MNSYNFLQMQNNFFTLLGFDIHSEKKIFKRPAIAMLSMLPLCTFNGPMLTYVYDNITDIDKVTQSMSSVFVAVLALFKICVMVYSQKDIAELLSKLRIQLDKECRKNQIYANIIKEDNRSDQTFCKIYNFFLFFAATAANLIPLLSMLTNYLQTGHTEPEYPYPSNYPWDNHNPVNYIFSYLWGAIAGYAVVIGFGSNDTLFSACTHNLCSLFKIVAHKVTHIRLDQPLALSEVLQLHQYILEISARLNLCFQLIVCAQFLCLSLQLGLMGYQVATNFAEPLIVFNVLFICSLLMQLYIYSYCGENIKTESLKFAQAVYASPWYETSKSISTSLHIAMMRAQRPCVITGYIVEANMESFSSIVRSTMSYITLLQSFN